MNTVFNQIAKTVVMGSRLRGPRRVRRRDPSRERRLVQ
jgi:hypothetical protein